MKKNPFALALLLFTCACGSEAPPEPTPTAEAEPAPPPPADPPPPPAAAAPSAEAVADARDLGGLAHAIDADPSRATAILTERAVDAAALERRLFTVASDPELTRVYLEARASSN